MQPIPSLPSSLPLKVVLVSLLALCLEHAQTITTDIHYGSDAAQTLDIRIPAGAGFPALIFVHGGSLTSGDKADSDYAHVCNPFPASGIACVNVNYRLGPEHVWPAQAEDVAAAIGWVHKNIASYHGDPRKLFLLGHSSGAMLVALLGADEHYLVKQGMKSADLRGVMPMGSIMWDEELDQALAERGRAEIAQQYLRNPDYRMYGTLDHYQDLWPFRHIHAGLPPFLFLMAEAEQEHPPVLKTNSKFVEEARKLGNQADYKVFAGRKHSSMIRQLHNPGDEVFGTIVDFIRLHEGSAAPQKSKSD